jgi:hypothetical protein
MPKLPDGFQPANVSSYGEARESGAGPGGPAPSAPPGWSIEDIINSVQDPEERRKLSAMIIGEENADKCWGFIDKTYWATWLNLITVVVALIFWPCLHMILPHDWRDYFEMSCFHSFFSVVACAFLYKRLHEKIRFAWWFGPNSQKPYQVALMIFASSYMVTSFMYFTEEWFIFAYNMLCLVFFLSSLISGKYIQLVVTHLFFMELGSFLWSAEHLYMGEHGEGFSGMVGIWLVLTRLAWCYWCHKYVIKPFREGIVVPMETRWSWFDYLAFYASIFIVITCTIYGFLHLIVELDNHGVEIEVPTASDPFPDFR